MYKSTIVDILKSFSKEEIREFRYFVRSPFFNRSKSVVKLFDQLRKNFPEFNERKLHKKIIYKNMFGNAVYNDDLFRVLTSNLAKLAKEYLIYVNSRNSSLNQKLFLLNELNVRRLEKLFPLARKEADNILNNLPQTDLWYFHDKAFLEDSIYIFNQWCKSPSKKRGIPPEEEHLKIIMDLFTRFYVMAFLMMVRKIIYINKYGKIDIDLPFSGDILEILETRIKEFADTPVISLHLNEILLLTKGDRKYFETLKELFINGKGQNPYPKIFSLHNVLQKYVNLQILRGKLIYKKEKLFLFKSAITMDILKMPNSNYSDPEVFFSIVNTALELKETGWAERFIKEHLDWIAPEARNNVYNALFANILLTKRKHEQALKLLKNIKTKKTFLLLNVKIIQLKVYYELKMFIEADMLLDTFRHLLPKTEHSLPSEIYQSYRNFSNYYSVLIKAMERNKPEKKLEVLKKIKKEFTIAERSWLLKKAYRFSPEI